MTIYMGGYGGMSTTAGGNGGMSATAGGMGGNNLSTKMSKIENI